MDAMWFGVKRFWLGVAFSATYVLIILYLHNNILHVSSQDGSKVAPLLLISFDGFRWDYLMKYKSETPNFQKMIQNGVYATSGIKSVFETFTIPSHWTIVTGLYTESHKVFTNELVDPVLKARFIPEWKEKSPKNDRRYYDAGGEPIWVTNQIQNNKARSGSVMWFGGDNLVKWVRPTFHVDYDDDMSLKERFDIIVNWFYQEYPINLGLIYFYEPDVATHFAGIGSEYMKETIKQIDITLGYLFDQLKQKDLLDDINIIILSDHGMADTPKSKLIMIDDIIPPHYYERILTPKTPLFNVVPKPGMEDEIYNRLKEAADKPGSHFQVYKKEDIPERFRYKYNPRVLSFIAIADLEYIFIANHTADEYTYFGQHGFDNGYQEMRPFFVAMGPSFKKDFTVETFDIVDIYPLMCHLLHLTPAPNNGSLDIVSSMLVGRETSLWSLVSYMFILIASIGGVFLVVAYVRFLKRDVPEANNGEDEGRMGEEEDEEENYVKMSNTSKGKKSV